ncbi:MBL fold metallo-hydrolase [Desulfotalea psychrophila]|uniref:Metallo-beta-lactamase domain-containing protein n=1 Tax=Desulfotalea psychrophila (strain LSv54 / DSM 12343) TaxID=177439 RepID=Q6AJZ1_DESPS|nr:MBL fold metallo-hydrolase [Desulfotalea psychrophila]CAG37335.1 conserved hypothetical protein [Desulfotalea psychrophila LSv54]
MRFSVLGSGSRGNSVYIESGKTAILIDAGFSGKEIERRLAVIGRSTDCLRAICVTHEHRDHVGGVGVLARRCKMSVWANEGTLLGSEGIIKKIDNIREFETGDILQIGDLELRSFSVMHDSADPVGYIISNGEKTLGYCTDTGYATHLMAKRLSACDGLILEANHDPDLLRMGPYPLQLQQRVRSRQGHLANEESAQFLQDLCHEKLQCTVLAHLSETNNTPQHALRAVAPVAKAWPQMKLHVADQHQPLPMIDLG